VEQVVLQAKAAAGAFLYPIVAAGSYAG